MESGLKHVAIIMDGNRRWAAERGLPSEEGHDYAAMKVIKPIVERCVNLKIPYVTFWAFSTENWKRDEEEIRALFSIFRKGLRILGTELIKKGARMKLLGEIDRFPKDIAQKALDLIQRSQSNSVITVTFALNYGGRDEILRAVKKIVEKGYKASQVTEELFSSMLDTVGTPDPDMIIRTGGEQRLSGYLPWQSVYAELYFTKTLFPDFTIEEFDKAVEEYSRRDRRFGGSTKK
jgi:undecaprenyl diphosphate synthase